MSEIIKTEVEYLIDQLELQTRRTLLPEKAFSFVNLKYFFDLDILDLEDWVTDGSDDGGIDFLYFDEEETKVILCQSKYTENLKFDDVINEFNKMYSTVQNFKKSHTGSYNAKLKKVLQNALDRLPEENPDNIEYSLFTTASVNIDSLTKKIKNTEHLFPTDAVSIYTVDEIEKQIQRTKEQFLTVKEEKLEIDESNNFLEYESEDLIGIMCNVLSSSIVQLYNKYSSEGLFDLNIRRYIRNNLVDSGIKKTLDKDRDNFWFLNNGIIIACTDFSLSGNILRLTDFSIVNGGQTTTLIGSYKGDNDNKFYIPCKIVATKDDNRAAEFFTKIAEATNSQKPIYPRDLKSNTPEMKNLGDLFERENIYVEIKRGFKPKRTFDYSIKNDELGQLLLSFIHQQPGTARSGKRKIFDTPSTYDKLFKVNYANDSNRKGFIIDLVNLDRRYTDIGKKLVRDELSSDQVEIFKNGKQVIFALLGVCYRLVNGDVRPKDLHGNPKSLASIPFVYGSHISNYRDDDLDKKLTYLIKSLIYIVADAYNSAAIAKQTTSVSNFLKTDLKYYNEIVSKFLETLTLSRGEEIRNTYVILKRSR